LRKINEEIILTLKFDELVEVGSYAREWLQYH